jgi:hypothetical protein
MDYRDKEMNWPFGKNKTGSEDPVIHIHEDDWAMRSLHPRAAWEAVADDIDEALDFANKNHDPVTGYPNDIRAFEQPETNYLETSLTIDTVKSALSPHMPFVSRFYATIGSVMESAKRDPYGHYDDDAICFGFNEHCFIKIEPKGNRVKRIWFDALNLNENHSAALKAPLLAIEELTPSVIADYWHYTYGPLCDDDYLSTYLTALEKNDEN